MEIDIQGIIEIIKKRQMYYYEEYHKNPKYIKLPLWVFNELKEYNKKTFIIEEKEPYKIFNMIICETDTIFGLTQIEVF